MKNKIIAIITVIFTLSAISVNAANIPRESAPANATEKQIIVAENLINGILDEVQSGLGYADARAKSNKVIFNAWLDKQTGGYSYGTLTNIANNAIFQHRDMYLRPQFYIENESRVKAVIGGVITQYVNGEFDYDTAVKNSYIKIYQSVNPNFNPDVEFAKDTCYRDIPAVDSALFTIARKLLIYAK